MKNCFTPNLLSEMSVVFKRHKITFYRCVGNFRDTQWTEVYHLYEHWKEGGNPFGGAFIDMPNKTLEVFYLIEALIENHTKGSSGGKRNRS